MHTLPAGRVLMMFKCPVLGKINTNHSGNVLLSD